MYSITLGVEAVRAGESVCFGSLAEIVSSMAKAEREGNLAQRVRFLARNSLLIVAWPSAQPSVVSESCAHQINSSAPRTSTKGALPIASPADHR
ncbi:MAG: ATP-binding protein [Pigmentiphaga sp.]